MKMYIMHKLSLIGVIFICLSILSCSCNQLGKTGSLKANDSFSDPQVVALATAAQNGDVAEIDRLVAAGVDVNAIGREGMTPLFWAFIAQNKHGFKRLLEHHATPNIQTKYGDSVMSSTAEFADDSEWLGLALKYGGDPNYALTKNPFCPGRTPIYDAINKHHTKGVVLLIRAGADLDQVNHEGETPLEFAVHYHHFDIVYQLLIAGANYQFKCHSGKNITDTIIEIRDNWGSSLWLDKVILFLQEDKTQCPKPSSLDDK